MCPNCQRSSECWGRTMGFGEDCIRYSGWDCYRLVSQKAFPMTSDKIGGAISLLAFHFRAVQRRGTRLVSADTVSGGWSR